jgi:prepilin signal peptidase PulO-like enzyme (type II secretory pathway)
MLADLLLLPWWYFGIWATLLGLIIGSFLNVFIYRFHTGRSLSGSSHCLSCQAPLRWFELFPVLSYLALRARCRHCHATITPRYLVVEALTGLLFFLVIYFIPVWWLWPLAWILMSLLVVIVVYDINHMVIPDSLVIATTVITGLHLVYDWYMIGSVAYVVYSVLAGVFAYGFFAALWKYSAGRWLGYGDAKLAFPLGVMVGWSGVFSMLVLSFWVGTIISLGILSYQYYRRRRGQQRLRFLSQPLTMKSEVPFAPFLIVGFLLVYLCGVDVLSLISYGISLS